MTQTILQNPKYKTPIFDREELHKSFGGFVSEQNFDTSVPHWMTNEASYITSAHKFDYFCRQALAARDRRNSYNAKQCG